MSGMSVLSGFVSGNAPIHAPSLDPRFVGLDQSTALDLLEAERQGCELCVTSHPWCAHDGKSRLDDTVTHEGQLAFPGSDFRTGADHASSVREGKLFLVCLTARDLAAYPEIIRDNAATLEPVKGRPGELLVRLRPDLAEALGLSEPLQN